VARLQVVKKKTGIGPNAPHVAVAALLRCGDRDRRQAWGTPPWRRSAFSPRRLGRAPVVILEAPARFPRHPAASRPEEAGLSELAASASTLIRAARTPLQ